MESLASSDTQATVADGGCGAATEVRGDALARATRRYTLGEEIAHSVTHGVGALASIVGLVVLVVSASLHGNAWHIVSCSIFGTTLVLMYTASTLYHALPQPRAKRVFRILDHSAIYLLIAGTYTPFALVSLRGAWGWTLFGLVWAMAIPGIVFKALALGRLRVLSVVFYLAMGWLVVVAAKPLVHAVPRPGLMLIAAGGLAYTVGVVFFAWKRMPYHHMIWHLFVLAGSALHFLAVLLYVVPRAGSPA